MKTNLMFLINLHLTMVIVWTTLVIVSKPSDLKVMYLTLIDRDQVKLNIK